MQPFDGALAAREQHRYALSFTALPHDRGNRAQTGHVYEADVRKVKKQERDASREYVVHGRAERVR